MIQEKYSSDTENRIIKAARKVFIKNGLSGTRMQNIANEAKINKALLHYYFRSKEKLFDAVFKYAFFKFVPKIEEILNSEKSIFEKIELIAEQYIGALMRNQFIPLFVLHEINRNPKRLYELMQQVGITPVKLVEQIQQEIKKGNIINIRPEQLIINLLSLCVFPIAGRPLLQRVFFHNDKRQYQQFLESRKKEVPQFVINSIKVK
ncbi:MAG: TetR/AcrR family transcriptional regulator [Bacteroidales bacterium]|nr:MAG: TetR/AcrR family transcriptional regulator [Bacteroidales bacterium]